MGKRNYLIEGVSGAGKSAVCRELRRRGYAAVDGDNELAYQGDPQTGEKTEGRNHKHHIWDVEKVKVLVANQAEGVTFFCGGSRNFGKFVDLLDGVFVLEIDANTMNRRIDERVARDPTDFGARPEERELIARAHQTREDLPNGQPIDATRPIEHVVDDILERIQMKN